MKQCSKCGETRPSLEFQIGHNQCKLCVATYKKNWVAQNKPHVQHKLKKYYNSHRDKILSDLKNWRRDNKDVKKNSELISKYGFSIKEFNELLSVQKGLCAICRKQETSVESRTGLKRALAVDHSHSTRKVRGLLCSHCNRALGLLKENVEILKSMIAYIERHK